MKYITEDQNFKRLVKELIESTGKKKEIGEMLQGVRVNLMYNADKCPEVDGVHGVKYYIPKKIMGLKSSRILFLLRGDEILLCGIDMET